MQTFEQWCAANHVQISRKSHLQEALIEYLGTQQTTWAWLRKARKKLPDVVNAEISPLPLERVALKTAANRLCARIRTSGALCVVADQTWAQNRTRPAHVFAPIPSPDDFCFQIWGRGIGPNGTVEVGLVRAYVELLIDTIRNYQQTGVPHSNEIFRICELVLGQLRAFMATRLADHADATMVSRLVFDENIPGSIGATTLNMICTWWSNQREQTQKRRNECAGWNTLAGKNTNNINLRRFGSAGEAVSIIAENGFKQAPRQHAHKSKGSFERYKWFVDLSVANAGTSVDDTQRQFDVYLCTGAVPALAQLKRVYQKDDQPAVTFKPDMGGETGCFGVHEDVLPLFNGLISRIVVHDIPNKKIEKTINL